MNESGLEPLGRCLLVKPEQLEIEKSVIQVLDSTIAEAHMLQMQVRVVEVGPHCWPDEPKPRCQAGDVVMISKMSGSLIKGPADGKQYRAINDRDVFIRVAFTGESNG